MYVAIGLLMAGVVCAGWWGWSQRARLNEVEWAREARETQLKLEVKRVASREEATRRAFDEEARRAASLAKEREEWERCAREHLGTVLKYRTMQSEQRAFLERMDSEGVNDRQVLAAFGMADDGTAWWKAVNGFVALQARIERGNALTANLSSESRHYNAGRAAALEDLREQFVQLRARGQEEGAKAA